MPFILSIDMGLIKCNCYENGNMYMEEEEEEGGLQVLSSMRSSRLG